MTNSVLFINISISISDITKSLKIVLIRLLSRSEMSFQDFIFFQISKNNLTQRIIILGVVNICNVNNPYENEKWAAHG